MLASQDRQLASQSSLLPCSLCTSVHMQHLSAESCSDQSLQHQTRDFELRQLMNLLKAAIHTLKPDCFRVNLLTSTLVQALRKENHMLLLLMAANQMLRKVSQSEHQ